MKKLSAFLLAFFCFQLAASAQWVAKNAGFTSPNALIFRLSVPSADIAWACALDTATFAPVKQVVKTTDGGQTWAVKDLGVTRTGQQISDVFALNGTTAWVTAYDMLFDKGKIYKTTDGGTTWTGQTTASFNQNYPLNIYFTDANNGVVLGDIDNTGAAYEIYTTANGGTTWTRVPAANIPALLPGKETATGTMATFGNHIWFVTEMGRIFHSANKGLNWTVGTTNGTYITGITFKDANTGWVITDMGLEKTTNGGQTWIPVTTTAGTMHYGAITYVPGTPATLISTGDNDFDKGTSISTDGGLTWTDIETTMMHTAVKFTSLTNGYAGSGGNTIHKFNGTVNSVSNEEMAKEIKVYPNPSNGIFKLQTTTFSAEKATVSVYNMLGQNVLQLPATRIMANREIALDLSKMSKGSYIVKIEAGDKVLTRQLMLQK